MQSNMMEQRLWSYLHAENIARGGEWIETRLMASGHAVTLGIRSVAVAKLKTVI